MSEFRLLMFLANLRDRNGMSYPIKNYTPELLSRDAKTSLVNELAALTGIGFMRNNLNSLSLRNDVENHVLRCERLRVVRYEKTAIAFLAASLRRLPTAESLYHVEGVICHPKFEGRDIAFQLLRHDLRKTRPHLMAFHTQNRRMVLLGERLADLNPDDAMRVAPYIGTRNQKGVVDVERYGGRCLYGDIERFAPSAVQEINYLRGDALICAGPVRPELFA